MLITVLIFGLVHTTDAEAGNQTSCRTLPVIEGETGNMEFMFRRQAIWGFTKLFAYLTRNGKDVIICQREEQEAEIRCTVYNTSHYNSEGIVNGSLRLDIFNVSLEDAGMYELRAFVNDIPEPSVHCVLTVMRNKDDQVEEESTRTADLTDDPEQTEEDNTKTTAIVVPIVILTVVVIITIVVVHRWFKRRREGTTIGDNTNAVGDQETREHLLEESNTAVAGEPAPLTQQADALTAVVVGSGTDREFGLVEKPRWYHRDMDESEARELLLQESNTDGSFLIFTPKENYMSNFLAVTYEGRVLTIDIPFNGREFGIEEDKTFTTLQELVDYYSEVKGCLPHTLGQPCVRQTPNSLPVYA